MAGRMKNRFHYIVFFKPYGVLSQFTRTGGHRSLADYGPFPKDIYSAGRLDVDSEGLLLLTDDNEMKQRMTEPGSGHSRTYLAQVEHIPTEDARARLQEGVLVGEKMTLPAKVRLLDTEPSLPVRPVPIRFRKNVPTSWLEITLKEGRNRQVRKMTAAVGHPTLRLVRIRIDGLTLAGLFPGQSRSLTEKEIVRLKRQAG